MRYTDYLEFLRRNGTDLYSEKLPQLKHMFADDYMRRALVTNFLTEGVIDENLGKILLTKALITNYL